jgi:hypothetical protein
MVHLDASEERAPAGAVLPVRVLRAHASSLSGAPAEAGER